MAVQTLPHRVPSKAEQLLLDNYKLFEFVLTFNPLVYLCQLVTEVNQKRPSLIEPKVPEPFVCVSQHFSFEPTFAAKVQLAHQCLILVTKRLTIARAKPLSTYDHQQLASTQPFKQVTQPSHLSTAQIFESHLQPDQAQSTIKPLYPYVHPSSASINASNQAFSFVEDPQRPQSNQFESATKLPSLYIAIEDVIRALVVSCVCRADQRSEQFRNPVVIEAQLLCPYVLMRFSSMFEANLKVYRGLCRLATQLQLNQALFEAQTRGLYALKRFKFTWPFALCVFRGRRLAASLFQPHLVLFEVGQRVLCALQRL